MRTRSNQTEYPLDAVLRSLPAGLDTYVFDLRSVTAINNAANLYLRLSATSTTPANPSSTFGLGGTNRLDNVKVFGDFDPTDAANVQQTFRSTGRGPGW